MDDRTGDRSVSFRSIGRSIGKAIGGTSDRLADRTVMNFCLPLLQFPSRPRQDGHPRVLTRKQNVCFKLSDRQEARQDGLPDG